MQYLNLHIWITQTISYRILCAGIDFMLIIVYNKK